MAREPPAKRRRGVVEGRSTDATDAGPSAAEVSGGWDGPASVDPARPEHHHEEEEELPEEGLPCDTLVAITLLSSDFRSWSPQFPWPLVLKSQLYSNVADHTIVDRELDDLRRNHRIRLFKLPVAVDDYAVLPTEEYRRLILSVKETKVAEGTDVRVAAVLDWFVERVLPRCAEVSIAHNQLVDLLAAGHREHSSMGEAMTEQQMALLLKVGCITRQQRAPGSAEAFWFAVPNAGAVLKELRAGRQELLAMLRKRQYSEILERELERKKLRGSTLGMRFHIRDLAGGGALKRVQTTSGALLKHVRKF